MSNPYQSPEAPTHEAIARPTNWSYWARAVGGGLILLVVALLFLAPLQRGGGHEAARRALCRNNLRQIALAVQNYHDQFKSLPPAYTVDAQGNRLHSWRTLILPFLEEKELYDSIDLSKPWDDPANAKARATKVDVYHCPSLPRTVSDNQTCYLGNAIVEGCFPGSRPVSFNEIQDGLSNTILTIEAPLENAVEWMSPHDLDEQLLNSLTEKSRYSHPGVTHVTKVDGSVVSLSREMNRAKLRSLLTIAGGERPEDD